MPKLCKNTIIACSQQAMWDFHADPQVALPRLTPPGKRVHLVHVDRPYGEGSRVVMKVRVAPLVWMTWSAVIESFSPPDGFIDVQQSGPFKAWRHKHTFEPVSEGCRLIDEITYELPFGFLGRLGSGVIRRDIEAMFNHRHQVTRESLEDG